MKIYKYDIRQNKYGWFGEYHTRRYFCLFVSKTPYAVVFDDPIDRNKEALYIGIGPYKKLIKRSVKACFRCDKNRCGNEDL